MTVDADDLKNYLIEKARDPDAMMTTTERAIYSLISMPKAAQEICSEAEREALIRQVAAAIDAAVAAATRRVAVSQK